MSVSIYLFVCLFVCTHFMLWTVRCCCCCGDGSNTDATAHIHVVCTSYSYVCVCIFELRDVWARWLYTHKTHTLMLMIPIPKPKHVHMKNIYCCIHTAVFICIATVLFFLFLICLRSYIARLSFVIQQLLYVFSHTAHFFCCFFFVLHLLIRCESLSLSCSAFCSHRK